MFVGLAKIRAEAIKKRYREKQLELKARGEEADLSSSSNEDEEDKEEEEEEDKDEEEKEESEQEEVEEKEEDRSSADNNAQENPPPLEDLSPSIPSPSLPPPVTEEIPFIKPSTPIVQQSSSEIDEETGLFSRKGGDGGRKTGEAPVKLIEQVGRGLESLETIEQVSKGKSIAHVQYDYIIIARESVKLSCTLVMVHLCFI